MKRYMFFWLVGLAAAGLALVEFSPMAALSPALAQGAIGGSDVGIMGPRNARAVSAGWGGSVWDYAKVQKYIVTSDSTGVADKSANTVTFSGQQVTIDMVAVEPNFPDTSFEVHGLVKPTLVVPAKAVIHLNLVNMDYGSNMEHGVFITTTPPPYPVMETLASVPVLAGVPIIPWSSASDPTQANFAALGSTFSLAPGTYWYICPTPGHATAGMYGKLIVK